MRSRRFAWLVAVPILLFFALFSVPDFRWLIRAQTGILLDTTGDREELQVEVAPTISDAGPQWYQIEWEARKSREPFGSSYADRLIPVIEDPSEDLVNADHDFLKRREMLRSITSDFPEHRVAVYAHLLAHERVWIARDTEMALSPYGIPYVSPAPNRSFDPKLLSAFDQDAAEGERMDPDNAYFPLMRAVGLFAAQRDTEGLAAIECASKKPRYDDYIFDEAHCLQQRLTRLHGRQGVLPLFCCVASVPYVHFWTLHSIARLVAYKAGMTEAAGHTQEGFRIRHAMMRCGILMRVQSRCNIGSNFGTSLFAMQKNQPCGIHYTGLTRQAWDALPKDQDQHEQRKLDYYCAYLKRIGHPEELNWVRNETEAGKEVRAIFNQAENLGPVAPPALGHVAEGWKNGLLLLINIVAMMVLCCLTLIAQKFKRDGNDIPLVIAGTVTTVFFLIALGLRWPPMFTLLQQGTANLSYTPDTPPLSDTTREILRSMYSDEVLYFCSLLFSVAAPLLVLSVLGGIRLFKCNRSPQCLTLWSHRLMIAITLLLVLSYAGVLHHTARMEAEGQQALNHLMLHEGRYKAELLGKSWPN